MKHPALPPVYPEATISQPKSCAPDKCRRFLPLFRLPPCLASMPGNLQVPQSPCGPKPPPLHGQFGAGVRLG